MRAARSTGGGAADGRHEPPPARGRSPRRLRRETSLAGSPAHPQDRQHVQRVAVAAGSEHGRPSGVGAVDERQPRRATRRMPSVSRARRRGVDADEKPQGPVEVARLPQPAGVVDAPREALVRARQGCCRRCSRPAGRPAPRGWCRGDGCRDDGMLVVAVVIVSSVVVVVGRVVGRMSWWSTRAPRTRPAAFSAKSSRSPVRGSGPISRTAATSRVRHPMRAAVVMASVMCMRISFACMRLARTRTRTRTGIHGAEVVGRWTHSAHGRMRTGERGSGLYPDPLATRTWAAGG